METNGETTSFYYLVENWNNLYKNENELWVNDYNLWMKKIIQALCKIIVLKKLNGVVLFLFVIKKIIPSSIKFFGPW